MRNTGRKHHEAEDPVLDGVARWWLIAQVAGLFAGESSSSKGPIHEEEAESLLGYASKGLGAVTGKAAGAVQRAREQVEEYTISRTRWVQFFVGIILGAVLMSFAMMFFPVMVLMPGKFSMLFTAGSLCFLGSFSVLKGHKKFLDHLISAERLPLSVAYFGSIIGTMWAAEFRGSYIFTLGFCIGQIVALSYFLVSYIPGGTRFLSFIGGMALDVLKSLCCMCCKRTTGSLPL